ncbi:division/cell wall cluster transcriptional repressor MraZ [Agathobaculum sp. Marseille-P7918]|uniref:division/cell wall cluster transcriptional repressor MraZ n=1 Tax=Agathobaculum sp. Marseille-P7918 TaxID=2479843 RepID=UPI001FAA93F6|nr:division/cell wall cluster transcriptional repressor MraZ [Agathobaculum sp. Marseille-P7918]
MNLVKGEYKHSVDAKGRLAMPAKLREELGERFTVTKGLDGCLAVYPEKEWEALEDRIRSLGNGEKARRVKRYYFANAFDAQLDAQGRILIPANLREFADLQKDVVVIGQLDHAEIWNSEKWRVYNEAIDAESVAADVEDMDF